MRVSKALTVALVLVSVSSAFSQDACIQRPPPDPIGLPCRFVSLPADLETPDYSETDLLVSDVSRPWAQMTTPPYCIDHPNALTVWEEGANKQLARRAIFQRPKYSRSIKLPLIIWAHPMGSTDAIDTGPDSVSSLLSEPALQNGFAFMSIETRHPTASRVNEAAPPAPPNQLQDGASPSPFCAYDSTDIAIAIQWARLHASQMMIDRNNIFVVGQSRGSLAVLTAFMKDQKDNTKDPLTDFRAHSSKPNAVFAAQAQVTYRPDQTKQVFLRPLATSQEFYGEIINGVTYPGISQKSLQFPLCKVNGGTSFDYHCQYDKSDVLINPRSTNALSALDELDVKDPPVWLRYEREPTSYSSVVPLANWVPDAGTDQTKHQDPDCYDRTSKRCLDVHHPNFGLALRNKYLGLAAAPNKTAYVNVQYAPTAGGLSQMIAAQRNFYQNYWCFFIKYKPLGATQFIPNITADGETRRLSAMQSYKSNHDTSKGDPNFVEPSTCGMAEGDPWDWSI